MENEVKDKERFWTIELSSKASLKNVTMTNGSRDSVLVEGTLGELVQATFADGIILEVVGKKGTLRINLGESEIKKPGIGHGALHTEGTKGMEATEVKNHELIR